MLVPAADAVARGGGAGRAEASEFYSRRRVNGVWVTGRFAKAEVDAELDRIGRSRRPVRTVRRVVRKAAPAVSARRASVAEAAPTPPQADAASAASAAPLPATTAAVPVLQASGPDGVPAPDREAVAAGDAARPPAAVAEVAPSLSAADPDADRMERLRLGLQRRALAILAGRSEAPSGSASDLAGPARQEKVEPAPPTP